MALPDWLSARLAAYGFWRYMVIRLPSTTQGLCKVLGCVRSASGLCQNWKGLCGAVSEVQSWACLGFFW